MRSLPESPSAGMRPNASHFDLYVQPTYDIARRVYRDYSALLDELHERVTRGDTCEPIIRYLEDRRREVQPDRDQIRALITRRLYEGRVTRFEAGVLGRLGGAVTSVSRHISSLLTTLKLTRLYVPNWAGIRRSISCESFAHVRTMT